MTLPQALGLAPQQPKNFNFRERYSFWGMYVNNLYKTRIQAFTYLAARTHSHTRSWSKQADFLMHCLQVLRHQVRVSLRHLERAVTQAFLQMEYTPAPGWQTTGNHPKIQN